MYACKICLCVENMGRKFFWVIGPLSLHLKSQILPLIDTWILQTPLCALLILPMLNRSQVRSFLKVLFILNIYKIAKTKDLVFCYPFILSLIPSTPWPDLEKP